MLDDFEDFPVAACRSERAQPPSPLLCRQRVASAKKTTKLTSISKQKISHNRVANGTNCERRNYDRRFFPGRASRNCVTFGVRRLASAFHPVPKGRGPPHAACRVASQSSARIVSASYAEFAAFPFLSDSRNTILFGDEEQTIGDIGCDTFRKQLAPAPHNLPAPCSSQREALVSMALKVAVSANVAGRIESMMHPSKRIFPTEKLLLNLYLKENLILSN
jgi:hypothetical protein